MATSSLLMTRVPQLQHQSKKTYGFLAQRLVLSSLWRARNFSARCALLPPDVPRLAETARITLTSKEVEDFAPKIQQVIDWFGQLQAVDLESIEPALRADTECDNLRPDVPETFENREGIIAAIPKYDEPYLKVPRILNN